MANTVLKTANSRVFMVEGRAGPATAPTYQSCFRLQGITQNYGDISNIECPDPYNYGKFLQVAQIRAATDRVTATVQGRYYQDLLSSMLRLAKQGCAIDVQLHIGVCTDPSDFDTYQKVLVLEEAYITSYKTDDLGALVSGDNAAVNETIDISATRVFEVRPLSFTTKADSTITNEVLDITLFDSTACAGDDCSTVSDGCTNFFALTTSAGGSPSTPADVVLISGTNAYARDVDTLGATNVPTAIAGVGSYVVVTSAQDVAYHYALKSKWSATGVPSWTRVATTGGAPTGIHSLGSVAFIAGTNGYVWKMTSATAALTTLQSGGLTTSQLNAVHAIDTDNVLVVGNSNIIMVTSNGADFTLVTPPAATNFNTCFMISKKIWWIGGSNGNIYYTTDAGATWTAKSFSGSGSGTVKDIVFSTNSVGYMAHTTSGNVGRIFRTINGGYTWNLMPDGTGSFPTNQRINSLAVCTNDVNQVYGAGLGVSTDGIVAYGYAR